MTALRSVISSVAGHSRRDLLGTTGLESKKSLLSKEGEGEREEGAEQMEMDGDDGEPSGSSEKVRVVSSEGSGEELPMDIRGGGGGGKFGR
jgi:hypothetical protein